MKKILFFIQNGVGGAERMTINIAKLLSPDIYSIVYCKVSIPYRVQNGRIDDFIPKFAKIINISWNGQIAFLRQFYKVIKQEKPDIIFSSVMPYNQRLLLLRIFFKNIKFIVRNDNYLFTINKLKRLTLKYIYRFADIIITQTQEMRDELKNQGLNPEKLVILHNIIDKRLIDIKSSETSPFSTEEKVRFVSVGRLAHQKGFDILIRAFRLVQQTIPNAELYIVGGFDCDRSDIFSNLSKLVGELNLINYVHFTGYSDNPYKYIKNASAYVLSSRFEGLPNVLIEAQYLKTPIAATECIPAISRMVENGKNGFTAIPENPQSLAEAMINASRMKTVIPVFKSSSEEDFVRLFNI